jgi:hypothetical protein
MTPLRRWNTPSCHHSNNIYTPKHTPGFPSSRRFIHLCKSITTCP